MQAKAQRLEKELLTASHLLMRCYRSLVLLQLNHPGSLPHPVEAELLKFVEAHEGTRAHHVSRKVLRHSDASLAAMMRKSMNEKYPNLVNPGKAYDDLPPAVSAAAMQAIGAAFNRSEAEGKG